MWIFLGIFILVEKQVVGDHDQDLQEGAPEKDALVQDHLDIGLGVVEDTELYYAFITIKYNPNCLSLISGKQESSNNLDLYTTSNSSDFGFLPATLYFFFIVLSVFRKVQFKYIYNIKINMFFMKLVSYFSIAILCNYKSIYVLRIIISFGVATLALLSMSNDIYTTFGKGRVTKLYYKVFRFFYWCALQQMAYILPLINTYSFYAMNCNKIFKMPLHS